LLDGPQRAALGRDAFEKLWGLARPLGSCGTSTPQYPGEHGLIEIIHQLACAGCFRCQTVDLSQSNLDATNDFMLLREGRKAKMQCSEFQENRWSYW
jgi:hypothetical protein